LGLSSWLSLKDRVQSAALAAEGDRRERMTDTNTTDDAAPAKPKAAKETPKKKAAAKKAAPKKAKAAPTKKAKAVPGKAGISDIWKKVLGALGRSAEGLTTDALTKVCEKHEAAPYWNRFIKAGLMDSPERGVYRLTAAGKKAIAD
jgi:cell division septation protein DedD